MLMEEPIKVVREALKAETSKTVLLFTELFMLALSFMEPFHSNTRLISPSSPIVFLSMGNSYLLP